MQDSVVQWASDRGLEGIPQAGGSDVLIPYGGETSAWTAYVSVRGDWLVIRALFDLEIDHARLPGALRYAALVARYEPAAAIVIDPESGAAGTQVATVVPAGADAPRTLDAAWEASVRVTDRWVPGLRDVASGIDPDAAFGRVSALLGGLA